jgi:hypothetical protein
VNGQLNKVGPWFGSTAPPFFVTEKEVEFQTLKDLQLKILKHFAFKTTTFPKKYS